MNRTQSLLALVTAVASLILSPALARAADYHHVHITGASPSEGVKWYTRHLDCEPVADRPDAADCDGVELIFMVQPTMGSTQGTGVNHIGLLLPRPDRQDGRARGGGCAWFRGQAAAVP